MPLSDDLDFLKIWARTEARLAAHVRNGSYPDVVRSLVTLTLDLKEQHMALADAVAAVQKEVSEVQAAQAVIQTAVTGAVTGLQGQAAQIAALKTQVEELLANDATPAQIAALQAMASTLDQIEQGTLQTASTLQAATNANVVQG